MARYVLSVALFRVLWPILVFVCVIVRPSYLSAVYLLVLFYLPFVPIPSTKTLKGHPGYFLIMVIFLSCCTTASQIAFHIYLASDEIRYGTYFLDHPEVENWWRNIGFVRLNRIRFITFLRWIGPEILMLTGSIGYYLFLKKAKQYKEQESVMQYEIENEMEMEKQQFLNVWLAAGKYILLAMMCTAAILKPSFFGLVYHVLFLVTGTWWGSNCEMKKIYAIFIFCFLPVFWTHMSFIFAYQIPINQEMLSKDSRWARLLGLSPLIMRRDLGDPRYFTLSHEDWATYINPIAVYILYYIAILQCKHAFTIRKEIVDHEASDVISTTSARSITPSIATARWRMAGTAIRDEIRSTAGGAVTFGEVETMDDTQSNIYDMMEDETLLKKIVTFFQGIVHMTVHFSYVLTVIVIMLWGVTFVSWISLFFLLWGIFLWIARDQRKCIMINSPFLILYGSLILLLAYVFSLDTTDEELPVVINGFKLSEIMAKSRVTPYTKLSIRCFYIVIFWITLRQYMIEKTKTKQGSVLVATNTESAVAATQIVEAARETVLLELTENILRKLLIWFVVIFLYIIAVIGRKVNAFRIVDMVLFLFVVIPFQFSFKCWRKMLGPFLLVVIAYGTLMLVLVYSYQFQNFEYFWEHYLSIPKHVHYQIGLWKFIDKADYFYTLFVPTLMVTITNLYYRYFHRQFLKMTDPDRIMDIKPPSDDHGEIRKGLTKIYNDLKDFIYALLEQHMIKVVYLSAILMCTYDICAPYGIIIFLMCISLMVGKSLQMFTICVSTILVAVHMLVKMTFQTDFFQFPDWDVQCKESIKNSTAWMGLKKLKKGHYIYQLIVWNSLFIASAILLKVVVERQRNWRKARGLDPKQPPVVFPEITVDESNRSLKDYLKYITNYGFYRFGVEICLMMTALAAAVRMDIYSIFYFLWILLMFVVTRRTLRIIWFFYMIFLVIAVCFQYLMAVGLPPFVCYQYPWHKHTRVYAALQDWAFLADNHRPLPATKIIFDFIILMLVSMQWHAFITEWRYAGRVYPGGSNDVIIDQYEDPDFKHPSHDFFLYNRSYLDIAKNIILPSFSWVTMSVVFLASTSRINIFFIGYLMFALFFMWHGIQIYLSPIPRIISRWNWLITYNLLVMLAKSCFQIIGCMFIQYIPLDFCWLVELLGIGCVRKFANTIKDEDGECSVTDEFVGLGWDVASFVLLVIQRRILYSYDFFHMIDDAKANAVMETRGADIFDQMAKKRMEDRRIEKVKLKEKVELKLSRLIANQEKIQGAYNNTRPTTHQRAVRSGDYYMFDEIETSQEIDLLPAPKEDKSEDDEILSIGKLLHLVMKSGMKTALIAQQNSGSRVPVDPQSFFYDGSKSFVNKVLNFFIILRILIESLMITAVNFLNSNSYQYRKVTQVMSKEKKNLKQKTNYHVGMRIGPGKWWEPAGNYQYLMENAKKAPSEIDNVDWEEIEFTNPPILLKLLVAIWNAAMSKSQIICLVAIFIDQIQVASILCLPMPLMIFLWGTLTIPRPSKTFWVVLIAYTGIMVFLEGMFQFNIMPGNAIRKINMFYSNLHETNSFYPPKIIGLYRYTNYALWDMVVLIAIFMHRANLKTLGMWKDSPHVATKQLLDGEYKLAGDDLVPAEPRKQEELPSYDNIVISRKKAAIVDHLLKALYLVLIKYAEGCRKFIQKLLLPKPHEPVDVYTLMFICDFVNFLLIMFFFQYFIKENDEGISENIVGYVRANKIPVGFLSILMVLVAMMVIDRALYLRKNVLWKIIFQLVQVIVYHIWLFILFPVITGKQCHEMIVPQIFYMVKCFYFLLSAYQIRCGYPTRILGLFCCKNFTPLNRLVFEIYMRVPFLFEIRTCMDWMLTDTSLSLMDWFKVEEIFCEIFKVQCKRHMDNEFGRPTGTIVSHKKKYRIGLFCITSLFAIVWSPLVLFSMGKTVGVANVPNLAAMEITIGSYEPVYFAETKRKIMEFRPGDVDVMKKLYNAYEISKNFIYNYDHEDIAAIGYNLDSTSTWSITPYSRQRLTLEAASNHPLSIRLLIRINYESGDSKNTAETTITKYITPHTRERDALVKMLKGEAADPVLIEYIMPKFLKVTASGTITIIDDLMVNKPGKEAAMFRNISLSIHNDGKDSWWRVTEQCEDYNFHNLLDGVPYESCEYHLIIYTFNDRVFSGGFLGFFTGKGILALYGIYFWVIFSLFRDMLDEFDDTWIEELPNGDRIWNICQELYLCRENGFFEMEELLYAKLAFIMRSLETLLILTIYGIYFFAAVDVTRRIMSTNLNRLWFTESPNPDKFYNIILMIRFVREIGNLELEGQLFEELVFLCRSREISIKVTRFKGDPFNPIFVNPLRRQRN